MKYVLYFLLVAVIFGLIALVDFIFRKLFPGESAMKQGKAVRMPRYSFILGLILTLLGVIGLLYIPYRREMALWLGCWVVLLMGAYLLVNFCRFGIFYDDERFVYRTLTRKAKTYRYSDIQSQRSFLARSGYNTILYVAGDEIQLYAAMQGLSDFLNKAFFRWCAQKGVDPDTVETNPDMLLFFPDPDENQDTE